jgi:DNA-binding response OmpR family regulator
VQQRKYRVVLIEDNVGDVIMITRALEEEAHCDITVLSDGDKAYRYFQNRPDDEDPPELIVLDLNLPVRDGTEVLDLIRSHPKLSATRVAIVSSSPKDVMKGRAAQADCYVTKPSDLDKYLAIGKELLACIEG